MATFCNNDLKPVSLVELQDASNLDIAQYNNRADITVCIASSKGGKDPLYKMIATSLPIQWLASTFDAQRKFLDACLISIVFKNDSMVVMPKDMQITCWIHGEPREWTFVPFKMPFKRSTFSRVANDPHAFDLARCNMGRSIKGNHGFGIYVSPLDFIPNEMNEMRKATTPDSTGTLPATYLASSGMYEFYHLGSRNI